LRNNMEEEFKKKEEALDRMEAEEETMSIMERFHKLEKECLGFENFVNCEDKYYLDTLERMRRLVIAIQREHLFSDNEQIKEIETDHLR